MKDDYYICGGDPVPVPDAIFSVILVKFQKTLVFMLYIVQ